MIDSVPGMQPEPTGKLAGFAQDQETIGLGVMDVADISLADVTSAAVSWADGSGMITSSSGSSYSTPPSEVSRAPTSTGDWVGGLVAPPVSRAMQSPAMSTGGYPTPFVYDASPPHGHVYPSMYDEGAGVLLSGYDEPLYNSQIPSNTVRSLSPHLAQGPSSETLVTAPIALAADRVVNPMACGRQPETAFGLLVAQDDPSVSLSREVRHEMAAYISVYWEKVHPLYPIIHRQSFEDASGVDAQHHDALCCAMAAVATQFLGHREDRNNGSQLHAYALQTCKAVGCAGAMGGDGAPS